MNGSYIEFLAQSRIDDLNRDEIPAMRLRARAAANADRPEPLAVAFLRRFSRQLIGSARRPRAADAAREATPAV